MRGRRDDHDRRGDQCPRALPAGRAPDNALGADVQFTVRGYRAGLVSRKNLLETVARTCPQSGNDALRFNAWGNVIKL